jgi:hypothetical protein
MSQLEACLSVCAKKTPPLKTNYIISAKVVSDDGNEHKFEIKRIHEDHF